MCLSNGTIYFNSDEGVAFIDQHLPVLVNCLKHPDWIARKAAVTCVMVMIKSTEQKGRLTFIKPDIIEFLSTLKSDKYKPVRDSVSECMVVAKQIPDMLSSRLATFSQDNRKEDLSEMMHNFLI